MNDVKNKAPKKKRRISVTQKFKHEYDKTEIKAFLVKNNIKIAFIDMVIESLDFWNDNGNVILSNEEILRICDYFNSEKYMYKLENFFIYRPIYCYIFDFIEQLSDHVSVKSYEFVKSLRKFFLVNKGLTHKQIIHLVMIYEQLHDSVFEVEKTKIIR